MNKHYTFQEYLETFSSFQDSYDYYFEMQKEIDKLREENNKLNNIIDELEKYMLERRLTDIDGRTMVYQILDKLNKLKGDNK